MKFEFPKIIVKELVHPLLREGYRDKAEQIAVANGCTIEDVCTTLIEEGIDEYEAKLAAVTGDLNKVTIKKKKRNTPKGVAEIGTAYCQNYKCPRKGTVHFIEDMIIHYKLKFCSVECKEAGSKYADNISR